MITAPLYKKLSCALSARMQPSASSRYMALLISRMHASMQECNTGIER